MVLPIIIVIVAALLAGGATAAIVKWDDIVIAWKGKKLAVLGARGVGKSHLLSFLSNGSILEKYEQTLVEKKPARRFELRDLDLALKETLDVGGGTVHYAEWKKVFLEADVTLYLLRADLLCARNADYEKRVRDDLKQISSWIEERQDQRKLYIIGTHCDQIPEYMKLTEGTIGTFTDNFRKLPIMVDLVARGGGAARVKVVLGRMDTLHGTEILAYSIFSQEIG